MKFFKQIYGDGQFKGSRGYVLKFLKRHNIRFLKITGEKLSSNVASVDAYVANFSSTVRHKQLGASQRFNADESGLFFKSSPSATYVAYDEKSAPGSKVHKDRITFMPCSNADGSLKLPLMIIGKSKNPRVLKNITDLPVYYRSSKNAWQTRALFREWFFQEFVPKVKAFLKKENLPSEAVLVLDNCSAHCSSDELKSFDGAITTIFLPPQTTAILQPMDQNIIQMIKANYRRKLLREIHGRPGEFEENIKLINIKDAIFWVAEAWNSVPAQSIIKSWNMLYREPIFDNEDDIPLSVIKERLTLIQQRVSEHEKQVEDENAEFDVLSDADIVNALLNPDESIYNSCNNTTTTLDETMDTSLVPHDDQDSEYQPIPDQTALNSIDTIISWCEENRLPLERQFQLRELRGNILEKIINKKN